jgi:hypothetical protein
MELPDVGRLARAHRAAVLDAGLLVMDEWLCARVRIAPHDPDK